MSSLIFSDNPAEWYLTDAVVINEQTPAGAPALASGSVTRIVAELPWGPEGTIIRGASAKDLTDAIFGKAATPLTYKGAQAIVGKTWGQLEIMRVVASGAVKASRTLSDTAGPLAAYKVTAKHKGLVGNQIMTLHTKTGSTFTLAIKWGQDVRTYPGLTLATLGTVDNPWVDLALDVAGGVIPDSDGAYVALASGADGSPGDSDYTAALAVFEGGKPGGVVLAGNYTSAAWRTAAAAYAVSQRAQAVLDGDDDPTDFASALAVAVALNSDRVDVALHGVKQAFSDGVTRDVQLAPFVASQLSQIPAHYGLGARAAAEVTLAAVVGPSGSVALNRTNWILADQAGGIMLEARDSGGYVFHAGLTTSKVPAKALISRRRVLDIASQNVANALEPYQALPNVPEFRRAALAQVRRIMELMKGTAGLPATRLIEDYRLSEAEGAVEGANLYSLAVKTYGERRYSIATITLGATVDLSEFE